MRVFFFYEHFGTSFGIGRNIGHQGQASVLFLNHFLMGKEESRWQVPPLGIGTAILKWDTIKAGHTWPALYLSERNQAARSNCSSSLCCHSHATVPHIVALLGFSFYVANIRILKWISKFEIKVTGLWFPANRCQIPVPCHSDITRLWRNDSVRRIFFRAYL